MNRITRVVTRAGDDGLTSVGQGTRVKKSHLAVKALGDLDELNCSLGNCPELHNLPQLSDLQQKLFDIGGHLVVKEFPGVTQRDIDWLEEQVERIQLPPLKDFVLPRGPIHLARAVCRRAERSLVELADDGWPCSQSAVVFLNRLSDYLFLLARVFSRNEETWDLGRLSASGASTDPPAS